MASINYIEPLENETLNKYFVERFYTFLSDEKTLRFLSFSLFPFSQQTVENMVTKHHELMLDYYAYYEDDSIEGILVLKRDVFQGFELHLCVVNPEKRNLGIGEQLIDKAIELARLDFYKSMNVFVFTDNTRMQRLLLKKNFIPIQVFHHSRADGGDMVQMRHYFNYSEKS